jgi:hypothetical protein
MGRNMHLSEAHQIIGSIVRFAESHLKFNGQKSENQEYLARDVFGSAKLNTGKT